MERTPADGLESVSKERGTKAGKEHVRLAWLSMVSVSLLKKISANMRTAFEDGIEARIIVGDIPSYGGLICLDAC